MAGGAIARRSPTRDRRARARPRRAGHRQRSRRHRAARRRRRRARRPGRSRAGGGARASSATTRSSGSRRTPSINSTAPSASRSATSRSDRCSARRRKRPATTRVGLEMVREAAARARARAGCRWSRSAASRSTRAPSVIAGRRRVGRGHRRPAVDRRPGEAHTGIHGDTRPALARDSDARQADCRGGPVVRTLVEADIDPDSWLRSRCNSRRFSARPSHRGARRRSSCPTPTGRYPVGTTTWRLTDPRAQGNASPAPASRGSVEVLAWYPAAAPRRGKPCAVPARGAAGGAHLRDAACARRADGVRRARRTCRRTPSWTRRRPRSPQKFPVLVFSHGYTGIPSAYTALLEDLASHGYAVLSVVHPYEATAATLADGRVVIAARRRRHAAAGDSRGVRRVADRRRDDGRGDADASDDGGADCGCCADIWRGCTSTARRRCSAGSTIRSWSSIGCPTLPATTRRAAGSPRALDLEPARRVRPFDGRRHRGAVLPRRSPLPGRAESRWHPAIRAR